MSSYLGNVSYFETTNQYLKTTQLLNPLLIIYKAKCTTTPICNVEIRLQSFVQSASEHRQIF